jgi:ankyrin repeat protein
MQNKANIDNFIAAINAGDLTTLQDFVNRGASLDTVDNSGYPMFYYAILTNKPDIINFFLNNFKTVAEVNARDHQHVNITPLGAAAQHASKYGDDNSFDYLKRLIAAGARLNPDNSSSPIVDAIKFDGHFSYKVVDFLTEYENHKQEEPNKYELPLITAVKMGNIEMVQLLLSKFANMAILDGNCNYIIKEAIISNNLDIVKLLVDIAPYNKIPFDKNILIQDIANHYDNNVYAITKCLNFLKIKHTFRYGEFVLTTQDYGNEAHRSGNTPTIKQVTRTCIIDHKICSKETHEVLDTSRLHERDQSPLYVVNKKGELFVGEIGNHSFFLKGTKGKTMLGDSSFYGYGKTMLLALDTYDLKMD